MHILSWKGVVSHFRNADILFTKSWVHLCKFIALSAVVALAVSLLQRPNGKSCDGSEEELGAWREKTEHKCSLNAVKSASKMMSMRESSSA